MASFGQKFVLPDLPPVPHHPVESFDHLEGNL